MEIVGADVLLYFTRNEKSVSFVLKIEETIKEWTRIINSADITISTRTESFCVAELV